MNAAAGLRRERADRPAQLGEERRLARLDDGVNRVEPQSVEAVIAQPRQRILDGEAPHLRHVVIDGLAPGRAVRRREERRGIMTEVISLRPEVIVDDVEKHHQGVLVCRIDERSQIFGATVGAVGCERQHAVVAPVPPSGEIRDRHQLDRG